MEIIDPSQILMPATCWGMVRSDPRVAPPEEGKMILAPLNRGRLASRCLYHASRKDEQVALWIPDGVRTVRGILTHLHRASEVYRTDLQEFARAEGFAVYAMLSQWVNFHEFLPDQLAKLGAALGHPEVANVPWASIGGSRNVAAMCSFANLDPDRFLCILANGGPGIAIDLTQPAQVELFRRLPVCSVNGSEDPYVEGNAWLSRHYPILRSAGLPWAAAVDWGGVHAGETNGVVYWSFVRGVMALRYPAGFDPMLGKCRLEDFPQERGLLVGPVDWDDPGGEAAAPFDHYVGDRSRAVWLPDAATLAVWRAYVTRNPAGQMAVESLREGGTRLRVEGLPDMWRGRIEFFDGDQSLGTGDPAGIATACLSQGLHIVHAVCTATGGQLRRVRPVLVADGRVIDQRAAQAAAQAADLPVNLPE